MKKMNSKIGILMHQSNSIPVNLIRQWYFCTRIPFYQETLGTSVQRPQWVDQGASYELLQRKLFKRRNLSRFQLDSGNLLYNVTLSSKNLPFHGIADIIIELAKEIYVVEIKLNLHKHFAGAEAQLTALSLLASEVFHKPTQHAFLLYGSSAQVKQIEITEDLKQNIMDIAHQITTSLEAGNKPHSSAQASRCTLCEYVNYCNDR